MFSGPNKVPIEGERWPMDPMNKAEWPVELEIVIEASIRVLNNFVTFIFILKLTVLTVESGYCMIVYCKTFGVWSVAMAFSFPPVVTGASNSSIVKSTKDFSGGGPSSRFGVGNYLKSSQSQEFKIYSPVKRRSGAGRGRRHGAIDHRPPCSCLLFVWVRVWLEVRSKE